MKLRTVFISGWLVLGLVAGVVGVRADDGGCPDPTAPACRQVVVEYDAAAFDADAIALAYGLVLVGDLPPIQLAVFEAADGVDVDALIGQLASEPGVMEAERNEAFSAPDCVQRNIAILDFRAELDLQYRDQTSVLMLGDRPAAAPAPVTVAIVDSGLNLSHASFDTADVLDGVDVLDPLGTGDEVHDGVDGDSDGDVDEGWGHGTAVAGLIHALAPEAALLPVRVLGDECHGRAIDVAAGIVAASQAGAQVINVSIALEGESESIEAAVEFAVGNGALVVAPAGNAGVGIVAFPAQADETLAVASVDEGRVAPSWASYGGAVDLVGPGVAVLAPYREGFGEVNGSSFSTAMVSGVAALIWSQDPSLTATQVKQLLIETAVSVDDWNPALVGGLGAGLPQIDAALAGLPGGGDGRERRAPADPDRNRVRHHRLRGESRR